MQNSNEQYLNLLNFVRWVPKDQVGVSGEDTRPQGTSNLEAIELTVEACKMCSLHRTRANTVFGSGSASADWMFIGEAPGAEEDRRGIPFVGRAGQLLDSMIDSIGMNRKNVYVANVLKCRPPENRDPVGIEVQSCEGYLHKQIELIRPKVIISLGRFAAQSLLKTSLPIGKLRGELHSYSPFGIPLVATYHPAYLLRSPLEKRKAWRDLLLAKSVLS